MGRFNNKRAQQRAAQERDVPSRARFSKGPPSKGGRGRGRGRGRGGRDEGRGRGGRAVVQKIQNRVQQRKDHGGISIAKGSNGSISSSSIDRLARRHPLDGIDVSKLDTITLSDESVAVVERLLRFHHVWEGGGDEEERSPDNNSSANNKKDKDVTNDEAMAPEPLGPALELDFDAAAETYDDCCAGDYPDEPDILFEGGRISSSHIDPDEKSAGWGDIEDCDESEFVDTPIFRHLTDHFSFKQRDAIDAMKASRKRRVILARKERGDKDANARDNDDKDEGALLEMSLDWLSLHLDEDRLRRGFKVQPSKTMCRPIASTVERTFDITAVPHASLSVLPKLTKSQYEKEAKRLNLLTYLVRAGFHVNEVENAFVSIKLESKLDSFGDQSQDFQPLAMLEGHLLRELVQCVIENTSGANEFTRLDDDVDLELATASVDERAQEEEVLRAIYAEEFQSFCQEENSRGRFYRLDVNPVEPLAHPACNEKCMMYVLAEGGYPLTEPPKLWFVNLALPPSLLRLISTKLRAKALETIGQASVYSLVECASEEVPKWQRAFIADEAKAEQESEAVDTAEEEVVDFHNATYTTEERKNLPRRQRQKLRAAEKSHSRDEIMLEKKRQKEERDSRRREKTRIDDNKFAASRAEKIVNSRHDEFVEQEAEKASRKAMNMAFLRGEDRSAARDAADAARLDCLKFHGVNVPDDRDNKASSVSSHFDAATTSTQQEPDVGAVSLEVGQNVCKKATNSSISEATIKTLPFVEKMRRMCEQKAQEKDDLGSLRLSAPSISNEGTTSHAPMPVASPTVVEEVIQEVIEVQRKQPWLISSEARVPVTNEDKDVRLKLSDKDRLKKSKISARLKDELERKYSQNGFKTMLNQRTKLPAFKMKDKLLATIDRNQVTVVSGDTGCGKTTQVPQMVLDDMILRNIGSEANILVTQPRRISAIGVSERIASERCEKLGHTCGYSIRLDSKRSDKTRLLLCTTGVLLRRLQCDPDLASVSHVFVDEVHERDLNTDFLLIILKDLLERRPSLKLVLMSATLNAERFSEYFGGCPTVSIPGRAQPVKEYRLEDALEVTGHLVREGSDNAKKSARGGQKDEERLSKTALKRMYHGYSKNVVDSLAVADEAVINYVLIAELLEYICTNLEDGAILVFLSGMKEITTCLEAINTFEYFEDSSNAIILPLHSSLSNEEQTSIFQRPPPGKRKIILSTNIAETSITVDDVVFVIDSGRVKENRYDDLNKMPTLLECWASKAATKQRRGRAGRVKPGFCWHLYSSHTHDRILQDYQLPEMLRVGLEDLVLQILVLDLGEPSSFLRAAVDPPTELAMKNALQLLESLGAAECNWEALARSEENATQLTALGYHLATLPVHPRVGKLLIYGNLFGVNDSCLTIAAAMTSRSPFVGGFENRDAADEAKREMASDDQLASLLAYNEWTRLKRRNNKQARAFLRENYLSYMALNNIAQLRKQLQKYMKNIGFVGDNEVLRDEPNLHLVKAMLAAGLSQNIIIGPKKIQRGQTAGEISFRAQKIKEVFLHPSTIAFAAHTLDSRYLCYHEIVKTSKVYVRDACSISKFSLLLFGGSLKVYQTHGVVSVDEWIRFKISPKPATLVKYLRNSMEALLLEKIMDPKLDITGTKLGRGVIEAVTLLLEMEC